MLKYAAVALSKGTISAKMDEWPSAINAVSHSLLTELLVGRSFIGTGLLSTAKYNQASAGSG